MTALQEQILQDKAVKQVIESQGTDGWLAWAFHGFNSMESGLRLLLEKGVEQNQPFLARALNSLQKHTDRLEHGLGKPGKILDGRGFGGAETIRACLLAQAGIEEIPFVKLQIEEVLGVFKSALQIESLNDLCQPYKGKLAFCEEIRWPRFTIYGCWR